MQMKKLLEIPMNAEVYCQDGACGHLCGVILNPITHEMTHCVLRTDALVHYEYLVPVDLVASSAGGVLLLQCSGEDVADLEPFHRTRFLRVDPLDYPRIPDVMKGGFYEWPYVETQDGYALAVETEAVPAHELAVHRGATMEATDGNVGQVNEFLVNPENNHISHLVLRQGHLWGKRRVVIPISAVDRVADDTVYLTLDKKAIGELPRIPLRRGRRR